eukprot:TRINITY_DN85_c0_g1_i1.p1 TRINITY_DN85_c0_g1~~TRINITY_DN85_c0_g1_i1.p1  ORF type:complete len:256 (-),score=72.20 TRINITY_DN85_c0_g1_i1:303-1070(-)
MFSYNHNHNHEEEFVGFWGKPTGIDWCEENYVYSNYIAEFWNSFTNISFFIIGIWGFKLCKRYNYGYSFELVYIFTFITGLASFFFHITLWWSTQKVDELSESGLLLTFAYMIKQPKHYSILYGHGCIMSILILLFPIFCEVHLVALILYSFWQSKQEINRIKKQELFRLFYKGCFTISASFLCWVLDRAFCDFLHSLPFPNPQFHAWWHLFCAYSIHSCAAAIAYAQNNLNNIPTELRYKFRCIPYAHVIQKKS